MSTSHDAITSIPTRQDLSDVAALRKQEGLGEDAVILIAPFHVDPPMRMPDDMCALLVVAVDVTIDAEPQLFAGDWLPEMRPADKADGDLVLQLTQHHRDEAAVDVEMLLACHGRWTRAGIWNGLSVEWPQVIASTVHTVMGLHTDSVEAAVPGDTVCA
ncbi:hypothetical protein SAMN04488074_13719 [Lentzea albidocapillata subsp. violacea]|uniref:Uncharacterized protein n=1 Tax=Lentzea albidocapillata subsp. violacea TaxID=128104 RepID=A0A1G9Z4K0_9PSEU|nr:hypothetical protein SAMN04488074_13719 [Lentzea albidocapillata subsp. violacea]